jgi:MoxR-like ATPase
MQVFSCFLSNPLVEFTLATGMIRMAKYIALKTLKWAVTQLKDSCNGLFVDFLLIKREGLQPDHPITISTKSTTDSAHRLMGIKRADGSAMDAEHVFFNPFVWQWRHSGYPRSGTYTSLERSNTLSPIVNVDHELEGMRLTLTSGYVTAVQEKLRRSKTRPLNVPVEALAAWALRYDEFPDDVTQSSLIDAFKAEYKLSNEEADAFFVNGSPPFSDFFDDQSLDRDLLLEHLLVLAPSETKQNVGSEPESVEEDLPEDLIEYLRRDLLLPDALLRQLVTLLRAGKHLILTGPPGTGKSTLAGRLAEVSEKLAKEYSFPASAGHIFTTATADWTTFDTLGGYMPAANGSGLVFQEGLFVQALRENKWIVVDELNRADVDKAFGQLFTVLSGHNAVMPFRQNGLNVTLAFDRNSAASTFLEETGRYTVGRDWRIIATMNTFDRNLLFQLSAAFVRRFAVVHVGIPEPDELLAWIEGRGLDQADFDLVKKLLPILNDVRPLGPAIWGDLVDYMSMRTKHSFGSQSVVASAEASFIDAVTAYVLPQLDGLDRESLGSIEARILELLQSDAEKKRLSTMFKEVF